jgi:hypothetical protein
MPSRILNFSADRLITGINIIDNMLFFTDNENEPRKINIPKFKGELIDPQSNEAIKVTHPTNGGATEIYGREFKERDISVLKEHPVDALKTTLTELGDVDISNIDNFAPEYAPQKPTNIAVTYTGPLEVYLKTAKLKARVDYGKNIIENGFYFTQTDPGDGDEGIAALISPNNKIELNNMPPLDITGSSKEFEHLIDPSLLSEGFIWVVAYAKEKGFDTEYSQIRQILVGNPSTATSSITNLNVKLEAGFLATQFNPYLRAEASYETQSPDQVSKEQIGFYISRGYSDLNESITTEELIKEAQESGGRELPISVSADAFDLNKQIFTYTSESHGINVEIGDTYYVVAYIVTDSGIIYSTPKSSVITDRVTIETTYLPTVTHNDFFPANLGAILSASASKWGFANVSDIQRFGFLVSTKIGGGNNQSGAADLRNAFSEGFGPNGKPIKAGFPETFRFVVKELTADFALSQNDFEYRTTEEDVNGNIINIGNGDGVLPIGTNLHVLAFVQMTTGQTAFSPVSKTVKITNINESALIITKVKLRNFNTPFFSKDMEFDVELDVAYTPPNSEIIRIGIASDLPRGNEISQDSIKFGFRTKDKLNNSNPALKVGNPTSSNPVFNFTATSSTTDHPDVGKYSTKPNDPLVVTGLTKKDNDTYVEIGSQLREDPEYTEQILETRHLQGLCAYAFMTVRFEDGTTKDFETPIRQGTWDDLTGISNTSTGQSEINSGAPQVNTHSTEPTSANRRESAIDIDHTGFTALGSLAANGIKPSPLEPVADLGFYVSTIPRPALNILTINSTTSAMLNWVADPATVKIPLTSIAAYQTHGASRDNTWKDFQIAINSSNYTPGITADTTYYIAAYCIPEQEVISTSGPYTGILDIENTAKLGRNKTKFGGIEEVKTLTTTLGTATTVDEPPKVIVRENAAIQTGSKATLLGTATPGSTNYKIQNPGFYAKPSQYISGSLNTADIINNLSTDPTSRVAVSVINFNKEEGFFSGELTGISEPYHYISFAQTVTPNGTTNTVYSTNFGEIENNSVSPPINDQFIDFDTPNANSNGVLNASCKNSEADVSSGNFGFYIVGREGSNFAAPADDTALKAIIDNPGAGDIVETITLNKNFTDPFTAIFNPKTNHKYYFVAFATTTQGNFSMSPVGTIPYKAAANQKIQLSNYIVEFEQSGYSYNANQTSADVTVVTTPDGAPWKFETLSWEGPGYLEPTVFKLGTNKLRIQTQQADSQTRSMRIRVSLVENSNVSAEIFVLIKGESQFGYNDFNSTQYPNKSPYANYY